MVDIIGKLDGFNGLLLSPHVDHLFDEGFISFKNNGDLLLAKVLNPQVLDQWALLREQNVGSFRPEQCAYLEYHRDEVFSG